MHHHEITTSEGEVFSLNVNGDFSGDVHIQLLGTGRVDSGWNKVLDTMEHSVKIPFEVLEELVGRKLQSDAISRAEETTGIEFLRDQR